jgi:hypothetical protein
MSSKRHHDKPQGQRPGQTRAAEPRPLEVVEEPMRCVWSGYPDSDRSCRSRIPASVVLKAWQREMQLKGTVEGFFYFAWRSGVWLAFGVRDGGVRGVYCPTHCSERNSRDGPGKDPPDRRPEDPPVHRTAAARSAGAARAARLSAVPG